MPASFWRSTMNLYLIGYRGSGKTTVAKCLAKILRRPFCDTDAVIESLAGQSIRQIFESAGESAFRQRESQVIHSIAGSAGQVISLGGGAVLAEANRTFLKGNGRTAWLRADPEVLWNRIANDQVSHDQRPNLSDRGGREEVHTILRSRTPVYNACADYTIDVDHLSPNEIAESIARWWNRADKE
jgi:shikimate kinase